MILDQLIEKKLGIDLGTTNTLIYTKGKRRIKIEPSMIAVDIDEDKLITAGTGAKEMYGKTPKHIKIIKPLKDGVISSFISTEAMLRYFLDNEKAGKDFRKLKVIICVPSGVTTVEKKAVEDLVKELGATEVYMIAEPLAGAIGVGLPILKPEGNMVVDIGGGTTEASMISLGEIVTTTEVRIGGNQLNESIMDYIKKKYKIEIGENTSEDIKIKNASVDIDNIRSKSLIDVRGRDIITGLPTTIKIQGKDICLAIQKDIEAMIEAIRVTFEKSPPELVADVLDNGIYLVGGGANLYGIADYVQKKTGVKTYLADVPNYCTIMGIKKLIQSRSLFKNIIEDKLENKVN